VTEIALANGTLTVTPARRLARQLRLRHGLEQAAAGRRVWPTPGFVSWPTLIEQLFTEGRHFGGPALRWLGANESGLVWERIIRDDPVVAGLIGVRGLGPLAQRSWRLLHDYAIPLEALSDEGGPESEAFARWSHRFARWLRDHDRVDLATAAGLIDPQSITSPFQFVGFDSLTPQQEGFISRLRAAGVAVEVVAQPRRQASIHRVQCRDAAAEYDAAARWAAALVDEDPDRQVAIVIPDLNHVRAQVRRAFDAVFLPLASRGGGPAPESYGYELAAARPLLEAPMVASACDCLAAFCHPADRDTAQRLLDDVYLGADAEASQRATLSLTIARRSLSLITMRVLEQEARGAGCPDFSAALCSALAEQSIWPERAAPSAWARSFSLLLKHMHWAQGRLDSTEYQTRERFLELLAELGGMDDVMGPIQASLALSTLHDLAGNVQFEAEEIRARVLVIDPETCAGMQFDGMWVCGLEATRWPAPAVVDPLLPLPLQTRYQIEGSTAESAARRSRRTLQRLCAAADEVFLSIPLFEGDAQLLPSALLQGVPECAELEQQWHSDAPDVHLFNARPTLIQRTDRWLPPVSGKERQRGGASVLELQSSCPFRAGAELRLGARALPGRPRGIDALTRGKLLHSVVADLWQRLRDSRTLVALTEDERISWIGEAIEGRILPLRDGAPPVLQHLLNLEASWLRRELLQIVQQDARRPPFAVADVEVSKTMSLGGLELELRIDRIDRLDDDMLAVIDYKTGSEVRVTAWLQERPKLPQLPLYVHALGASGVAIVAFARVRSGASGLLGLGREDRGIAGIATTPPRQRDFVWSEMVEQWYPRLETIAMEYAAGDARLAPEPAQACRYCHLAGLCRINEARPALGAEEDGTDD